MKTEISKEMISPGKAQALLDTRPEHQRRIRESYVDRLAAQMVDGQWLLSNDAIVIQDGALINGQHRLVALIHAKKTCEFIVMRITGDNHLYEIMDSGRGRTVADALKLNGVKYYAQVGAIIRLYLEYSKKLLTQSGKIPSRNGITLTRPEIINYALKNHLAISSYFEEVFRMSRGRQFIAVCIAGTFLEIARQKNELDKASSFLQSVILGTTHDDAAYFLRERLIGNATSKAKLNSSYILGLYIKAYHHFVLGVTQSLRMREGEEYPIL